jgi:hypothetical protein
VALGECNAIKSQGFGHGELTSGCFLRSTSIVSAHEESQRKFRLQCRKLSLAPLTRS